MPRLRDAVGRLLPSALSDDASLNIGADTGIAGNGKDGERLREEREYDGWASSLG